MSLVNAELDIAGLPSQAKTPRGGFGKRLFDLVFGAALLFAFLPLIGFIALIMFATERGPVFFSHQRIGYKGRSFRCLKFRSMVPDAARVLEEHLARSPAARAEWDASQKLRDDPRITPVGRFLRTTSLDELPQLINVLRGEMSLVGPRPIVQAEVIRYGSDINAYASARPGITGLWQVSGRSDVDYERRVLLDAQYVGGWSLAGDVVILAKTLGVVFFRTGSY